MNEQTGIFLTDEEVVDLADILHVYGYGLATNHDWEKGDDGVMDKVFERAVQILITKEKTK